MAIGSGLLVVRMDAPCQETPVDPDHRVKGTSLDNQTSNYVKLLQEKQLKFKRMESTVWPEMPLAKRRTDVSGFHIGSVHLKHEMLRPADVFTLRKTKP